MRRFLAAVLVTTACVSTSFAQQGAGFDTQDCRISPSQYPGNSGKTITVNDDGGSDHTSLQAAIDGAEPGDTIVVKKGVYHESVEVPDGLDGLRISGEDRDEVILDGWADANGNGEVDEADTFLGTGITVLGDNVLIENMTGRHYGRTAFFWVHQHGYWGRNLTAYNNADYGIYAFDARCGQFNDSYVSGNADGGFYIGECYPCDAVITDVTAVENALGYSGTNAGGNLEIHHSTWIDNALGIVPNSLLGEERPPQKGAEIYLNTIVGSRSDVPGRGFAGQYWGTGIVIAGGIANQIWGNTVTDQEMAGIALVPLPDQGSADDNPALFMPSGNVVWGNTVSGSGLADIAQAAASGPANCWADNTFGTAAPVALEEVWSCGASLTPPGGDPQVEALLAYETANPGGPFGARTPGFWGSWSHVPPTGLGNASGDPLSEWLPALL